MKPTASSRFSRQPSPHSRGMMAGSAAWNRSRPPPSSRPRNRDHLSNLPFADTARLRRRRPRIHRRAWSRASSRRPTAGWCGTTTSYAFLTGDAPASVHPSLWRQSQLCAKQGLYEVVEGIYQVRGLDLSNISFIEGDTGDHRHRSADLHRDGGGRAGAVPRASRRPAGRRRHLHPQPRRPLRRRARRDDAGRRRRGQGRGHRARALHRARRAGERLRRHRDGTASRLHVRRRAGARAPGTGGLRARSGQRRRGRWR